MSAEPMMGTFTPDLSWLKEFQRLFGAKVDLVLEPRSSDPEAPHFDYGDYFPDPRILILQDDTAGCEGWTTELASVLGNAEWDACLVNLVAIPPRSLHSSIQGKRIVDGAAFLAEALTRTPKGKFIIALSPVAILLSEQAAPFRAWLAKAHRVAAIVYMGPPVAELLGAHPRFGLALIVIRSGTAEDDEQLVLRLVNLGESSRSAWAGIVSDVAKRGGGEVGPSVVLRSPRLDERPWTYERFSKLFQARREDAGQLGTLRPLSDFGVLKIGLHRTIEPQRFTQLDESGGAPPGSVVCFGGRSIGKGGVLLSPTSGVIAEGLSKDEMLQPGDTLLRSIVDLRANGPLTLAATVTEDLMPATFDRSCIRIRWRPNLRSDVRELLDRLMGPQVGMLSS